MSPYEQARELYRSKGFSSDNFEQDVRLYAKHGYVLATPLEFAMVRPVCKKWGEEIICCVEREYQILEQGKNELTLYLDCWHIHVVVGELSALFDWLPYPLPWMSMERGDHFKIYQTNRFYEVTQAREVTTST